ncbi:MAG TPA: MBOAT family protein [Candidatus Galloscillospira excrementipullorum]|nr:MBOAT family protein [Candidatus Galloscillospira excrementipullorum]
MVFSSVPFLYVFLPVVLLGYFLVPRRFKNVVLLAASLFFYYYGERAYTSLLLISSLSDYLHSLYIEKHRGTQRAKAALISSIAVNLALLGFFKYADFLISTVNSLLRTSIPLLKVPLPIGISFFTFQTMSYTIDVYRGRVHAQKNLVTMGTFVCLFPQLVAGPIVRYSDIALELEQRSTTLDEVSAGARRFVVGLAKKVLVANAMGELCGLYRSAGEQTTLFALLYAAAFTIQIYYDFSGYSDMAIGLGLLFGFHFPENFNYPYLSRSVSEFWRRWHMTLGGWFRDYVYIPLGGNRVPRLLYIRNIFVVWALTGLWHGAAWNFVVWGLLFGVLLTAEKLFLDKWLQKCGRILPHVYVMAVVVLSFVLFNASSMQGALADIAAVLGLTGAPFAGTLSLYYLKSYAVLLAVSVVGCTPWPKKLALALPEGVRAVLEPVAMAVLLLLVTAYLVDGSFNPFLYFRF